MINVDKLQSPAAGEAHPTLGFYKNPRVVFFFKQGFSLQAVVLYLYC